MLYNKASWVFLASPGGLFEDVTVGAEASFPHRQLSGQSMREVRVLHGGPWSQTKVPEL